MCRKGVVHSLKSTTTELTDFLCTQDYDASNHTLLVKKARANAVFLLMALCQLVFSRIRYAVHAKNPTAAKVRSTH